MIDLHKCRFNKAQKKDIKLGAKIELEHTRNPKVALKIAKQHECEIPFYYSKGLIPMERKMKK